MAVPTILQEKLTEYNARPALRESSEEPQRCHFEMVLVPSKSNRALTRTRTAPATFTQNTTRLKQVLFVAGQVLCQVLVHLGVDRAVLERR